MQTMNTVAKNTKAAACLGYSLFQYISAFTEATVFSSLTFMNWRNIFSWTQLFKSLHVQNLLYLVMH